MAFSRQMPDFEITCLNCGKAMIVPPKERDRKFCGHSCAAKFHGAGQRNREELLRAQRERAERLRGTGTRHPYVKRGGRHEHRVVMEQKLGRPLAQGEIVHHDDGDGHNNAPDNLILTDRPEHARIHFTGVPRKRPTHCKRAHEFTPENTKTDKRGSRICRACERAYQAVWQRDKRKRLREKANENYSVGC